MQTAPDGTLSIELQGEPVLLHPARALILPARRTVLIADPHFGKDDVFRRAGIAVPAGTASADIERLANLIAARACERLVVLGDFLHAETKVDDSFLPAFRLWRARHPQLSVDVVTGNHDRRERVAKWEGLVRWHVQYLVEPPFVFAHEPVARGEGYVLAGHIHPVFHMARVRRRLRVPVFWQRPDSLVLPSFGSFTGGASIRPSAEDRLFAAGPERVIPIPTPRG
jgi:DNA ligase-associated metallophosphoesterase